MFHTFTTVLRSLRVRFYIWLRLRLIARCKVSSEQYTQLRDAYTNDQQKGEEMLQGALVINRFAKLQPEERTHATIAFGISLVTGTLGHELMSTGDPSMARATSELIRCLTAAPSDGVLGLGMGTTIRTMELSALISAAAIAAALLANQEDATPHKFLDFVRAGLNSEESFEPVRRSWNAQETASKREKEEGGSVSKEQADELEELFNLSSEEEAA